MSNNKAKKAGRKRDVKSPRTSRKLSAADWKGIELVLGELLTNARRKPCVYRCALMVLKAGRIL
jgi:hypothetical protein